MKVLETEPKRSYYLPNEVIASILEYSDLIAPFELEWNVSQGLVPYDCCVASTDSLDCCTCASFHGSYSATCKCWRLPIEIFLVSRQVYSIAQRIFYQRNRFIFLPAGTRLHTMYYVKPVLPSLKRLFNKLPQGALGLMRFIGIGIRFTDAPGTPKYKKLSNEWNDIVSSIAAACDLQNLCLVLFTVVPGGLQFWSSDRRQECLLYYSGIVERLGRLREVGDFLIYCNEEDIVSCNYSPYKEIFEGRRDLPGYDAGGQGKYLYEQLRFWSNNGYNRDQVQ